MPKLFIQLLITLCIAAVLSPLSIAAEEARPAEAVESKKTQDVIIFFPAKEAIIDGYTVTNKTWEDLPFLKKKKFISEGILELSKTEPVTIKPVEEDRLFIVLEKNVSFLKQTLPSVVVPMIIMLRDTLEKTGFLIWNDQGFFKELG